MKSWQLRAASLLLMLALSRVLEAAAEGLEAHEDRAHLDDLDDQRDQLRPLCDCGRPWPCGCADDLDDLDAPDLGIFPPAPARPCRCGRQ